MQMWGVATEVWLAAAQLNRYYDALVVKRKHVYDIY